MTTTTNNAFLRICSPYPHTDTCKCRFRHQINQPYLALKATKELFPLIIHRPTRYLHIETSLACKHNKQDITNTTELHLNISIQGDWPLCYHHGDWTVVVMASSVYKALLCYSANMYIHRPFSPITLRHWSKANSNLSYF